MDRQIDINGQTDTRFGSTTLHEACIVSGRALESAAYDPVVTSVLVGTLA